MNKKLKLPQICCLYYFIVRAGFLGITSGNLLHLARQDAWISIIIGMILGIFPLLLFLFLQEYRPNDSILDLTKYLFGNTIGKIINGILVGFIFLFIIIIFYDMIHFISSQYLTQTPNWAIAIMFFLPLIYILSKGLPIIARTHVILFYFAITLFLLAVMGLVGNSSFDDVKPILEFGVFPVLQGSFSFVTINILPLFLFTIIPRDWIDIKIHYKKKIIGIYLIACFTLLITLYLIISIFGIDLALLYQYPEFHLLKLISLVGFISRIEGILATQWLFDLFAFLVIGVYFILRYFKTDWKFSEKQITVSMVGISFLLIILATHILKNNTIAYQMMLHYAPFILFGIFFVLPFGLFIRIKTKN